MQDKNIYIPIYTYIHTDRRKDKVICRDRLASKNIHTFDTIPLNIYDQINVWCKMVHIGLNYVLNFLESLQEKIVFLFQESYNILLFKNFQNFATSPSPALGCNGSFRNWPAHVC